MPREVVSTAEVMSITINISSIALVAWWGAILSTIVFAWDIYKWRTAGARLRWRISSNMKTINIPQYEGLTLISVNVDNFGDRPTTITNLGFRYYPTVMARIRKKSSEAAVVTQPSLTQPIPFELKQGSTWTGLVHQTSEIETMVANGYVVFELYHSHSSKPEKRRLRFRD